MFLLDGVDIGDNLFARPDDLFIEEAIEETQVLTSAVSAEYGRFSGGVVNAVTKRGGNMFSGSVRSNLSNAAWTEETPFEKAAGQTRARARWISYYEGTFGGPLREDRAWFFFSGRSQSSDTSLTLAQTAVPFQQTDDSSRWELKLTATPMANQTVQVQYSRRRQTGVRPSLPITIDPTGRRPRRHARQPLRRQLERRGVEPLFATARYSHKTNHPRFGNTNTGCWIHRFSPSGASLRAVCISAPIYFDRTDPEDRDNNQLTGSVSYFGSRPGLGTHDVKGGVELFSTGAARWQFAVVDRLSSSTPTT